MRRVLVLGGSGFIGAHLTEALARSGDAVVAVGRRFGPAPPDPSVTRRAVDLYACSQEELRALVADVATVYHLAWSTFTTTAEQDPARDLIDNVGFFVRLLNCLKQTGARLIFCSSGGTVYGPSDGRPIREDHHLQPVTAYGAGKVAAEIYADSFRRAHGLDVRIARLANPYGLGQDPERLQGALTRFAAHAVHRRPIEVWGDGSVVRDYIHIDDAVEALQQLGKIQREALGSSPVFNIGSGNGTSLKELISMIERELGEALQVSYSPARATDVTWNVMDVENIRRKLGWQPTITLEQGIKRLLTQFGM